MNRSLLIFTILSLCTNFIPGQSNPFTNSNGRFILGTEKNRSASISAGDIDGDGDLDIVIANGRHWPQ